MSTDEHEGFPQKMRMAPCRTSSPVPTLGFACSGHPAERRLNSVGAPSLGSPAVKSTKSLFCCTPPRFAANGSGCRGRCRCASSRSPVHPFTRSPVQPFSGRCIMDQKPGRRAHQVNGRGWKSSGRVGKRPRRASRQHVRLAHRPSRVHSREPKRRGPVASRAARRSPRQPPHPPTAPLLIDGDAHQMAAGSITRQLPAWSLPVAIGAGRDSGGRFA